MRVAARLGVDEHAAAIYIQHRHSRRRSDEQKSARRNHGSHIKNLRWRQRSVRPQSPAGDVRTGCSGVVKFHKLSSAHFIHDDLRKIRGSRIIYTGRAAHLGACSPVFPIIGIPRPVIHERRAKSVWRKRPRRFIVIIERKNPRPGCRSEHQELAIVAKLSGKDSVRQKARIFLRKDGRISCDDKERARLNHRARWERERDSLRERATAQIERRRTGIFQFEKLRIVRRRRSSDERVVVDLGDSQFAKIHVRRELKLHQRTPVFAVQHPRFHRRLAGGLDRSAQRQRIGRDCSAYEPWVWAIKCVINRARSVGIREHHRAARRLKSRCRRARVEATVLQVLEHQITAQRDVGVAHTRRARQPVCARVGAMPAIFGSTAGADYFLLNRPPYSTTAHSVTPAGGLRDDSAIHFLHPRIPPSDTRFRSEGAAVEEMLLHAVGHLHAELRIHPHRHPKMPRVDGIRIAFAEHIIERRSADEIVVHSIH